MAFPLFYMEIHMSRKIPVAIIGATGYTGLELVQLLTRHPEVKLTAVTSRQYAGQKFTQVFPELQGLTELSLIEPDLDLVCKNAELVFCALPHGGSQDMVAGALERGLKVVDLSADMRLKKVSVYRKWYGEHRHVKLIRKAVYGLPEIYRDKIVGTELVANPGCYPTSVILGLMPLCRAGLIETDSIKVDSKSGASGAGRGAKVGSLFCEVNEGFRAYNIYGHRHTPEMDQELSLLADEPVGVTFVPHLLPINRGILSTIYLNLKRKTTLKQLHAKYNAAYKSEPFVRVLDPGVLPDVARVRATNFCDIGISLAASGMQAVIVSAIDNLTKGASGAAVQNMNLMLGLDETLGLGLASRRP